MWTSIALALARPAQPWSKNPRSTIMALITGRTAAMVRSTWKAISGGSLSAYATRRVSRLMPKVEVDLTLSALADRNRRAVIDLLKRQPLRAGEIAAALSLTPPAMSRHLRVLRRSGLIHEQGVEEDARVRIY